MQQVIRRAAFYATGLALGVSALPVVARDGQRQDAPNIVFIMADDLGYGDLSATGSRHIKTPAIDSLAAGGVTMTQAYANSAICSPTRAALLTGRYQYRIPVGLEEPLAGKLASLGPPDEAPTIASVLHDRGYHTSLIGKWHLGLQGKHGPMQHGYQHFFGIVEGAADYFRHVMVNRGRANGQGVIDDDRQIEKAGYFTDLLGDHAVDVIREQAPGGPFFISLHFTAPHWPWEGREDEELAQLISDSGHHDGGSLEKYAELVEAMDDNVDKVLAALRESGELDNTIVIFTSDNGGERFSEVWPFIGMKAELLEGGIRVPLFVQWPNRIGAGTRSDQMTISMDFLPTFLTAAGGDPETAGDFDGVNVLGQMAGIAESFERTLYWRFNANDQAAVRRGKWKYLSLGGKEFLFDLSTDVHERANRSEVEPEIFEELRNAWDAWNRNMLPYPRDAVSQDNARRMADRY